MAKVLRLKKVPKSENSKLDALRALVAEVNRTKGLPEHAKLHFGDEEPDMDRFSTGILTLDVIMGGGVPRGRMTQWKGAESCFKTSALMRTVASLQASGGTAVWLQAEEFDKAWAERHGVRTNELVVIPGMVDGDRALERGLKLVEGGSVDLLVVDSIQAVQSTRELEHEIGAGGFGNGSPQMWGQFCKRMARAFSTGSAHTACIWTSQFRSQIGKFSPSGDNSDGSQIWALRHWKAIDVAFRKTEVHKDGKDGPIYARTYALKCDKNKTSKPHDNGEFVFYFREHGGTPWGIDTAREVVAWSLRFDVIDRAGAWFSYKGEKLGQGIEQTVTRVRGDVGLYSELHAAVLAAAAE
jgi:recombination protein RecA